MNNFCPKCYSESFTEKKELRKINVRGCSIEYKDIFNICNDCNFEFDSDNNPDVLKDVVYPLYRKYNRFMTPEQFVKLKMKFQVTNTILCQKLNLVGKELLSFEKGCLQTRKLDNILKDFFYDTGEH